MDNTVSMQKDLSNNNFSFTLNKGYGVNNNYIAKKYNLNKNSSTRIIDLVNGNPKGVFIYLLSSIGIVLKKYMENSEIIISIPELQNDNHNGLSVPVKLTLNELGTFRELLNSTAEEINKVYAKNKEVSNQRVWSNQDTVSSNILVNFHELHNDHIIDSDKFDLIFGIYLEDDAFSIELRYNERYFHERQISEFTIHLDKTVSYYKDLNTVIKDIDIFTEEQKRTTISQGIGLELYMNYNNLHGLFEAQVEKFPSNVAVRYNDTQLTYKELNALSNKLANHLKQVYKVKPNQLIGLMAERSENLIVALLGIMKAGAAYVPIDPSLPEERKNFIISDAKISLVLIDSNQIYNIQNDQIALFALDMQLELLDESEDNLEHEAEPGDLVYVIYTSGTSGKPKGVTVRHEGAVNMTINQSKILGITNIDRVLQFASLSFDASVSEIFMALGTGACITMIDKNVIENTKYFIDYLRTAGINVLTLPPAYLYSLDIDSLDFLKVLLTAGEVIKVDIANKLKNLVNYFNAYGPSECSVCVSMFEYKANTNYEENIPIGRPLSNTQVLVLNNNRELVPEGVEGELYVSGKGLAKGYIGNNNLTNAKFVTDLYSSDTRWYKTGDMVKWSNGQLLFCGRNDRQIKLRGFRVELEEIESVIKFHSAIQNAYVFGKGTFEDDNTLTSVITIDPNHASTLDKIFKLENLNPDLKNNRYVLPNDLTIYHSNESETKMIYEEIFEQKIYDTDNIQIKQGDIIFDIGANIGLFSLYTGLKYKDVKVYAFEPVKPIYDILEKNMSLYSLNVKKFNLGISNETKEAIFQYYPQNTAISGMYADNDSEIDTVKQYMQNKLDNKGLQETESSIGDLVSRKMNSESVECQLVSLSEIIEKEGVSRIDLLKIDVEKSEEDVLMGIKLEHWPMIRQMVIEVHDSNGRLNRIEKLLVDQGYYLNKVQDKDLLGTEIYTIQAYRKDKTAISESLNDDKLKLLYTSFDQLEREIKETCEDKLPHYMIPSKIEIVHAIPLNNNGKVDESSLEKLLSKQEKSISVEQPRNESEQILFDIWGQILAKKPKSIFEDFFSLGGDSIKAIQIASKLHTLGYKIDINKIFEFPTIASLSKHIIFKKEEISQSAITGEIPLTPIQLELFNANRKYANHFNQSVLLFFNEALSKDILEAVFKYIQIHHDIFRATINKKNDNWNMYNHGTDFPMYLKTYDLIDSDNYKSEIAKISSVLQETIDLEKGPLMHLGLFNTNEGDFLLIIVHHMIIDTVSWRILLSDINILIKQSLQNEKLNLPLKTSSFKEWAEFLYEYAEKGKFKDEADYWQNMEKQSPRELPVKIAESNRISDTRFAEFLLDKSYTEKLLIKSNDAYNTEITDILISALSLSFYDTFEMDNVLINLETHGRQQISNDIDVSRTIGWFTAHYPVIVTTKFNNEFSKHIIEVKETLRRIPNKGIGYGINKFLGPNKNYSRIEGGLRPQIAFNYLGQFDSDINDLLFTVSSYDKGQDISPDSERFHDMSINGLIAEGSLSITIEYNYQQFESHEIQNLADAFKKRLIQIVDHCIQSENLITPSDITEEDLSMDDLDEISSLLN